MFRAIMDAVIGEFSSGQCIRDIANHWACRCTVPGPGMRKAAGLLVERYLENGADMAEFVPYPGDDHTPWLGSVRTPLEWNPHSAELRIAAPAGEAGLLCRYEDEPLCLISNSHATPPEGLEASVVIWDAELPEEGVTEGQWAGCILMTNQFPWTISRAAHKAGCVGLVADCVSPPWLVQHPPVRRAQDVPDMTLWTIFPGRRDDPPMFGFNLTPRQGARLREAIARSPETLRLYAHVEAEVDEGICDFCHATVQGSDLAEEEVWVLAHLSEPGARDNASGCCLSLELARVFAKLTRDGTLPPLRRTIRFMHAAEVDGFMPFLHENQGRLDKVVGGLCADSVGQDFAVCGGELVLFHAPETNGSFVDGLTQTLLSAVAAEPTDRFSSDTFASFPWHAEPFFGNDAFISDGFFDAPAPQLSTWPDKFYHSNLDTPDQMSDNTLGRTAAVCGTLLYLLATAGATEARWLAKLAAQDWKRRMVDVVNFAVAGSETDGVATARLLLHMGLQAVDAMTQTLRFAPDDVLLRTEVKALADDARTFAREEGRRAIMMLGGDPAELEPIARPSSAPKAALVTRRLRWHAPDPGSLPAAASEMLEGVPEGAWRVWEWINGRRTVGEIAERLRYGGEMSVDVILQFLKAMEAAGAVKFR